MICVHLTTSPTFGGPERQLFGLITKRSPAVQTAVVLFPDRGKSQAFRDVLSSHDVKVEILPSDTPHLRAMVRVLSQRLGDLRADILCCHGYKADVVGYLAARKVGIPVIAISHGWTADSWKVRLYEAIDKAVLRRMDRVICVSEGQAVKVRRCGVPAERVFVNHNAVDCERFGDPDPRSRTYMEEMFPKPPGRIIGSVGRLSPEKGFGVLIEAAAVVTRSDPDAGFVHFGDGPLKESLARKIAQLGLGDRFVLAGFRSDIDRFLPSLDVSVLPSFTEGLPCVVLESYAAGVPVVATAVGGTPEVVADGVDGFLVPPGNPQVLAERILRVLNMGDERKAMGQRGRERIQRNFTFDAQASRFEQICEELLRPLGGEPGAVPKPSFSSTRSR